jgi:hypothetical protein
MFIKTVLRKSFESAGVHTREFFHVLIYPGLGVLVTSFVLAAFGESSILLSLVAQIVQVYFHVLFAVYCHRIFLEREIPADQSAIFKWDRRKTGFLVSALGLGFVIFIGLIPVFFISLLYMEITGAEKFLISHYLMFALLLAPGGYIFSRLSLILPAAAADEDSDWPMAWDLSKGYGWSLFFLTAALPFLANLLMKVLPSSTFTNILTSLGALVLLFYEVAIFSNSYRILITHSQDTVNDPTVS